jgi:signal transduction histidine kinase/FixJ family two-component response regulator
MRLTPAAAAVPLVLVLLTWLSYRASNTDAERFDHALGALDRFALVESALQRDVLSARAGMLRDYDPLVREVNVLDELIGRLRDAALADAEEAKAVGELAASVGRQEELTEQFKSHNALLQNSLAYFRLFSGHLAEADRNGPLASAVSGLAAAMLQLTLDTSAAAAQDVADRLDELAAQPFTGVDAGAVHALLAHGQLLRDLLPKTDQMLKGVLEKPSKRRQESIRALVLAHQAASRATAQKFRLLLYATSVLLLGLLVHVGLRLRSRALALRRRAAYEHVIAGISTRLIDTQPHELDSQIQQALGELAELVHADRAYIVTSCERVRINKWCREGITFPSDWPDRASAVMARLGVTAEGNLHIRRIDRLQPGTDKDRLVAAGVGSWACVSNMGKGGASAILGFDALPPRIITEAAELGLLRMALDAVTNAVRREHLEQERSRLERTLQQARRMETIGALASGIAHNFNNIVGAILGYTEMAEGSDSRPASNLGEIRRAGERARDLVDQILAFGRRRDVQRRPVHMKELVAETRALLHASLAPAIDLVIREVPDEAVLSGEAGQLQQVILNLCSNAAQAMDQTGSIELETEVRQITGPRSLTHGQLKTGQYVRLAVSDTGRGMDKVIVERIFEPFFTTRLAGSGLGLATVREIVGEHGGAMNVWSAPGVGSRFEVWLPCIPSAAPAVREDSGLPSFGQGQTVLILNDAAERLLADEEMLAALGYEPVGFTHIDDAVAACREIPNRFDAAVMGYRAPVASALDLASALHEILPDVPILLATASADEITADTLLAAGVSAVVHLPLVSAEIAWALARCLRALNSNELHNAETVSRKLTSALLPLASRDRA